MLPTISIVTATRNCVRTIGSCLESASRQSYPHLEHIVVDGESNDGTLAVLQARRGQLAALVSEADSGVYEALNKGLRLATGQVVGFLHSDDTFASSDSAAKVASAFDQYPEVCAVYGDVQYVSKTNEMRIVRDWKSGPFSSARLRWGWMPPHTALYVRREWYERIGGFDARLRISADYDSILRLFSLPEFRSLYIPGVLVKMRVGGISNRSIRAMYRKSREDWAALRANGAGYSRSLCALAYKNVSKLIQFL